MLLYNEYMSKCIHCKSKPDIRGYGRVWHNGKLVYEHRLVFQRENFGIDIASKIIHHTCKNSWCINPQHLIAITRKEHSAEHDLSGWALIHSQKTICKYGHPLDGRNKKQRFCLVCKRKSANAYVKRNRDKMNSYKRKWRGLKKLIK